MNKLKYLKLERIWPQNHPTEIAKEIDQAGLGVMDYDDALSAYQTRLGKTDVSQHKGLVTEFVNKAYGGIR